MRSFDESWLAEYRRKRAADGNYLPNTIEFSLPVVTPTLNALMRTHWGRRAEQQRTLSRMIAREVQPFLATSDTFERARVTITRRSVQLPDHDGLVGGMKQLIDCLLTRSTKHPNGLGLIRDDSPAHMELVAKSERVAKRDEQGMHVLIERLA